MAFNFSPKTLEITCRWKKQTPEVQLSIQVFKENLSELKLGSGTFQLCFVFPISLNHITY